MEVKVGDKIKSPSGLTEVKNIYHNGKKILFHVFLQNGLNICCTADHKLMCSDGEMAPIHSILYRMLDVITEYGLTKIEKIMYAGVHDTMDIEVDNEEHVFYGNGIATSNSHAVSYATMGYQTAYIKYHFPHEFYVSWLNFSYTKPSPRDEIHELVNDCRKLGVTEILPPNIQDKNITFKLMKDKTIRFGLQSVKGVGKGSIKVLNKLGNDLSTWCGFISHIKEIRRNVAENLIKSGACDCFGHSRYWMLECIDRLFHKEASTSVRFNGLSAKELNYFVDNVARIGDVSKALLEVADKASQKARKSLIREQAEFLTDDKYKDSSIDKASWEKEVLGISLSCSPADDINKTKYDTLCREIDQKPNKSKVTVGAYIEEIREAKTRKGDIYCYMKISDSSGAFDSVVVWPQTYEKFKKYIYPNQLRILHGETGEYRGNSQLIVKKIEKV
jgi:DNA polymerase-3 subunit alpha